MTDRTFLIKKNDEYDLGQLVKHFFFTDACCKTDRLTYCVKCRKKTENLDSKIFKTKNNRLNMQSKCPKCGIKKSRFVKEQEAKGLLSNLGIKISMSKIPLLNVLF